MRMPQVFPPRVRVERGAEATEEQVEFAASQWALFDANHSMGWSREPFVIAFRKGEGLIAQARGWTDGGVGFLAELLVRPDLRGRGLGGRLLGEFYALGRSRGCLRLACRTLDEHDPLDFYLKQGWVIEARFEHWVEGRTVVQLRHDLT